MQEQPLGGEAADVEVLDQVTDQLTELQKQEMI
jgi:hypothetical protein